MSFFMGYPVPGDSRGRCLTLDDRYHGAITDTDANQIASELRTQTGKEPAPQTVRGRLIQLAKVRQAKAQQTETKTAMAAKPKSGSMLIGYARVSTRDQSTELQTQALKAAGCERIETETASGAQNDRPALAAALNYARPGDVLVVWKLDRLARSVQQLVNTVAELEKRGIGFQSLTEKIDTTTAGGKMIFHVFAALAEFERGLIQERTRAGLAAAKAMGRRGGRPRALDEKQIDTAQALLKAGMSIKGAARRLEINETTLRRAINSNLI